ncbi:MAG: hypothetical protein E7523_03540 [Ruminococcaceae bacterium]|nr:hypothetical protein [Oscillospiraceae bacterium]
MNRFYFNNITLFATSEVEKKAALFFADEMENRSRFRPTFSENEKFGIYFNIADRQKNTDDFEIECTDNSLIFTADRLRGLLFACAQFFKKAVFTQDSIQLIDYIDGTYSPDKNIRGHQLGYRTTPNTYDAWSYEQYDRYYRDMILMGCNTVEHIPYEKAVSRRNRLMRYDEEEFLVEASRMADEWDLDVSLWMPNCEDDQQTAVERRDKLFARLPRLNVVFPPGGDPGELEPDELIERCRAFRTVLKKHHPDAQMWPSAQQPHGMPLWGEDFLTALQKYDDAIDGVITGPNRAFELDVLRKRLPSEYKIRLYPDITHNVRCEYPVHFDRDDWHYALTTCLSRECINPRPTEYSLVHKLTRGYVIGSVSYSEGINDDVNKFVWSSLDLNPDQSIRDILEDYARLFFVGTDSAAVADAILALEKNWEGNPAENPHIETTLQLIIGLCNENPELSDNWRYNCLLFRACCDVLVRRRFLQETLQLKQATNEILRGNIETAKDILEQPMNETYSALRRTIDSLAEKLFNQIGLQLNVEIYCADNPERGAVLDTIDLPITDRLWLLKKLNETENADSEQRIDILQKLVKRNKVEKDEYYFSFALHELHSLGVRQKPDFYMNFQGDRPHINTGDIPVCMFKLYDHFSFSCKCAGFAPDADYVLQFSFKEPANTMTRHHKVVANGITIYEGKQFGGYRNETFEKEMLPAGYVAVCYDLPKEVFINGCLELEMTEPMLGFQFSEFRITKKIQTSD